MKKVTKGAIVTGLGVALLLGGGGTLAVWNVEQTENPGRITSGDLNLTADAGTWTSNLTSDPINITDYRVVPGETLTYTQDLTITLVGDELEAVLDATGTTDANGFVTGTVKVSQPKLSNGAILLTEEHNGDEVTATITVEFLESTTGRQSTNAQVDLSQVSYKLTQRAPSER